MSIGNNDDAGTIAGRLKTAINNSTLTITANNVGGSVTLVHQRKTALGNVAIMESVGDADFVANGMSGGAGGDCPAMAGCNVNDDCASGSCDTTMHKCQ